MGSIMTNGWRSQGFYLKRAFDEQRVLRLLHTICQYQVECPTPDMSDYDVEDSRDIVTSTAARLKHREPVSGSDRLREVNADFVQRLQKWLCSSQVEGQVSRDDFYAYMPTA